MTSEGLREDLRRLLRARTPLAVFKLLWSLVRIREEFCGRCGRSNVAWHTDDETFVRINGSGSGVLCLHCFDLKARRLGFYPIYRIEVENL